MCGCVGARAGVGEVGSKGRFPVRFSLRRTSSGNQGASFLHLGPVCGLTVVPQEGGSPLAAANPGEGLTVAWAHEKCGSPGQLLPEVKLKRILCEVKSRISQGLNSTRFCQILLPGHGLKVSLFRQAYCIQIICISH